MDKDRILAALPSLPKTDLEALQAVIAGLLGAYTGGNGPWAAPVHPNQFNACTAALGLTMRFQNLPPKLQQAFNTKSDEFAHWLEDMLPDYNVNKVAESAFLRDIFELLKKDLLSREVKPTIGTMIQNMGRMPYVIDQAFPNYLASGLGNLILRGYNAGLAKASKKTV